MAVHPRPVLGVWDGGGADAVSARICEVRCEQRGAPLFGLLLAALHGRVCRCRSVCLSDRFGVALAALAVLKLQRPQRDSPDRGDPASRRLDNSFLVFVSVNSNCSTSCF